MSSFDIFTVSVAAFFALTTIKYYFHGDHPERRRQLMVLSASGAALGLIFWAQLDSDYHSVLLWLIAGALALPTLLFFLRALSKSTGLMWGSRRKEHRLRGAKLVHFSQLNKLLKQHETRLTIGPLSFPLGIESRGFLFTGQPGSGKSITEIQILSSFHERDSKGIIFDENGSLLERFYRPGDFILNPLDSRSVIWSPFAEIEDIRSDPALIASSLIPEGQGEHGEWRRYAQQALAAVLKILIIRGQTNNQELTRVLSTASIEDLAEMIQGSAAARLLSPEAKGMAASVVGVLGSWGEALEVIQPQGDITSFSLKKWIQDDSQKNWIFITCRDDQAPLLERLIAAWFSIVATAVLSLRENNERRIVFALDEFDSLPKVQGLRRLITKGRKYGAVPILGLQNVSQLEGKYGKTEAKTILSSVGTWLCFRAGDQETARYLSDLLGKEERVRIMASESETNQPGNLLKNSKSSSTSEQIATPEIVLDSEIRKLPDRTCFIDVCGDYPVAKIEIPIPPTTSPKATRFA